MYDSDIIMRNMYGNLQFFLFYLSIQQKAIFLTKYSYSNNHESQLFNICETQPFSIEIGHMFLKIILNYHTIKA